MKKAFSRCLPALLWVLAGLWCPLPAQSDAPRPGSDGVPPEIHPSIGAETTTPDGHMTIRLVAKKQNYPNGPAESRDTDIFSPKSVNVHPNGRKYYVNSLEGGTTVVFDSRTHEKLKVIRHTFTEDDALLWSPESGLFPFRHHYDHPLRFYGKPVESTFSHYGRYLWVPYYRRSFDINAQEPSAVAIIDTESDSIVRMMETGPLPKMIATSPDNSLVAISHWGDNTVGLIDISSPFPEQWRYRACVVVDYQLKLDFSTTEPVDRDNGSGYALRGTVFTPDGRYLLVGCMGGSGGIAVIDVARSKYLGRVMGMMSNVRHLLIAGEYLYLSINAAGYVQRIPLATFLEAAGRLTGKTVTVKGFVNCKVGAGARTIAASPDGRYIFAACNNSSRLCVVDAKSMQMLTYLPLDSYPVGLDVSLDGKNIFVTSQGRKHHGGNCVDILEVTTR